MLVWLLASQCVPPCVYPSWNSLCFLPFGDCFLSQVKKVFSYYLFKYFLRFFLSLFSFVVPYNALLVHLICPRGFIDCLHFFSLFFSLFCSVALISTILSSGSLIRSSVSVTLLLIPSSIFIFYFSYYIVHFCLFFISSSSLLNISCIFSICAFIIFLRSWIIFTIITLNLVDCLSPLHLAVLFVSYLVPSSGTYSSAISFCLTFCDCGFCSTCCRFVVLLASAVYLLED